jgi:hypothetical protein
MTWVSEKRPVICELFSYHLLSDRTMIVVVFMLFCVASQAQ